MELKSDKAVGSVLSVKPRSSRVKRSHFEKWKNYDVELQNFPKFRSRKRAPVITDSDQKFDDSSERKRSKKSVSLSDDHSLGLKSPNDAKIPEQKPFVLNYDLAIPKRPRCVSKQQKFNTLTNNNILPFKKRKQEEFNFSDESKIVNSHIDNPQNSRFPKPKKEFENEFTKTRRRFCEVSIKDVDPFWILKQRIRVFWPIDKSWYFGTVKKYNSKSKRHYIKYDDHQEEWVDLKNERFKLFLHPNEAFLNGEDSELESKMDNDPTVSWISCKSRNVNNNMNSNNNELSQTNSAGEKNCNLVYFRKRFHNEFEQLVKLEFYVPIKGINFHFWLNRLPLFTSHGKNKIVCVSQTIKLEMVLIDNLLGLRIFNFEGYLNETIDILCFLISRFCPKRIIRKSSGTEMKMKNKTPCASIGIKISTTLHNNNNKEREMYFLTYRFRELGTLRYGLVEKYLRSKNCLKMKDLSVKKLTHFNACKISFAKDLLWPSFYKGSCEDLIHQNANIFKLDPEIVYIYQTSRNPSLFINKHLKFLMDKNTLTKQIHKKPNYSKSSWDNKTDRNSVSPTSVLSNDQNTPRSKKPRTLVSYTPLKETQNSNSENKTKTHYRKKHSWKQFNTCLEISKLPYTKTVQTKTIHTPGAHLMHGPDEDFVPFERPVKYHKEIGTEIERCMDPVHVVYDMDSDDEKWLRKYNKKGCNKLSDDIFERIIDSFEKFSYAKNSDELSLSDLEELDCFGGGFNVIHDVYEYWFQKRKDRNNLPLIRQFQPPLWEVYQKQVRDWQFSVNRFRASSAEKPANQKPALFAFCLKPKGLIDSRNNYINNNNTIKDSRQKSHKKLGPHFSSFDSSFASKRSNEASFSSRTPRGTGGVPLLAEARIKKHHHHKKNKINIVNSKWRSPVGSELEEFKLREASYAAIHAANLAKMKREKALVMFQKAELAMYKASCAILIADCVKMERKS